MNDKILEPMIHELDIVDEIGELGKDLVALHGINMYINAERRVELVYESVENR